MPTRAERETVIMANMADLDEGYFTVETTEASVLRRLQRVVGDDLEVQEQVSSITGKVQGWLCRVPAEFWRGSQLRVGRPKAISDAQREASRRAAQKATSVRKRPHVGISGA